MSVYSDAYEKHKNLRLAAEELGIKLPKLYYNLKKEGVVVTGDKTKYGSRKDQFGAKAEGEFQSMFPRAVNNNGKEFQAKIDFYLDGLGVDVKGAAPSGSDKRFSNKRWAFSLKKQESIADIFFCIAYLDDKPFKYFVIPGDLVRFYQTISIPMSGRTKWAEFELSREECIQSFI